MIRSTKRTFTLPSPVNLSAKLARLPCSLYRCEWRPNLTVTDMNRSRMSSDKRTRSERATHALTLVVWPLHHGLLGTPEHSEATHLTFTHRVKEELQIPENAGECAERVVP
jgi:carboxylesterase type B